MGICIRAGSNLCDPKVKPTNKKTLCGRQIRLTLTASAERLKGQACPVGWMAAA